VTCASLSSFKDYSYLIFDLISGRIELGSA
jgi:hypothetical protein